MVDKCGSWTSARCRQPKFHVTLLCIEHDIMIRVWKSSKNKSQPRTQVGVFLPTTATDNHWLPNCLFERVVPRIWCQSWPKLWSCLVKLDSHFIPIIDGSNPYSCSISISAGISHHVLLVKPRVLQVKAPFLQAKQIQYLNLMHFNAGFTGRNWLLPGLSPGQPQSLTPQRHRVVGNGVHLKGQLLHLPRHGGSPWSLDGFWKRENPKLKWMIFFFF